MPVHNNEFQQIYKRLRLMMLESAAALEVVKDEPGSLQIYTSHIMKNKQALYFGGVVINKNYVSYHLMPVYVTPELLNQISPELKRRMQGKSCFNFKVADTSLFTELDHLTHQCFESYRLQGYI
jgi:hypothetical protein